MYVTECNQKIERKTMSSLFFVLLFLLLTSATRIFSSHKYSRDDFPPDFIFGSATSAYQVEGAANEEGRTPSIWDTFAHSGDDHRSDEDISCDQYHKYKEDVQLMVHTGLDAYRFSISWSRLIPNGRGPVNPKGLEYYNNLINELTSHGIQPHVTLHHYDLPQALEDEYGGWVSRRIVKDFTSYANACFREFGDRVRHWTTMNEANIFIQGGYDEGWTPPKRCSPPFGFNCSKGNSSTEPYMAGHNLLLAHASAAHLYKKKYQDKQHGFIGINLFAYWLVPLTNTIKDVIATQRANDFYLGWFMEPLMFGDYPKIMKKNAGSRIPAFTSNESELVKGSFDFIGVNHYTSIHIKDNPNSLKMDQRHYGGDMAVEMIFEQDDPPTFGFPIKPEGMRGVLEYFKQAYGNPPIYIHENGQRTPRSASLDDTPRVEFIKAYIGGVLDAVRNGSNTRGYFAWSFLDVFELLGGFDESFGLYYVDLDDPDLKRYPKLSAQWYSDFLKRRSVSSSSDEVIQLNKNFSALPRAH